MFCLVFCLPQLWNTFHPPELVRPALERTLKTLKLDYVDLYIVELPMAFKVSIYYINTLVYAVTVLLISPIKQDCLE